jgi:ABC-type lipoprotein release transport system permease subunit
LRGIVSFALINLSREFYRYFGILMMSIVLIFFLASLMFVSHSIERQITLALDAEPDFVVQKLRGDRVVPIKTSLADALIEITGTIKTTPRVYGRYFVEHGNKSFLIIGVDFLDEQSHRGLEEIMKKTDLNHFLLDRHNALIGQGVDKWLNENHYKKSFKLFTPLGKPVVLKRFGVLPKNSRLLSNDMVVVSINTARKILGLKRSEVTDYTFNAPNELEWEVIPIKTAALDYDLRVISKKESKKAYEEMFDYKNGLFLLVFVMTLVAFLMIVYQRYSQLYSIEKRSIGILRALGWSMQEMLIYKMIESFIVVLVAYILGVSLAYLYVFVLKAPGLINIFVAPSNLDISITLQPDIDLFVLMSIFLLYALPFIISVVFPVWRVSTTTPSEAIR